MRIGVVVDNCSGPVMLARVAKRRSGLLGVGWSAVVVTGGMTAVGGLTAVVTPAYFRRSPEWRIASTLRFGYCGPSLLPPLLKNTVV